MTIPTEPSEIDAWNKGYHAALESLYDLFKDADEETGTISAYESRINENLCITAAAAIKNMLEGRQPTNMGDEWILDIREKKEMVERAGERFGDLRNSTIYYDKNTGAVALMRSVPGVGVEVVGDSPLREQIQDSLARDFNLAIKRLHEKQETMRKLDVASLETVKQRYTARGKDK